MPAKMENSAVATGLEKLSFHFNPKEGQRQRMFKLPHNCTHFTCKQRNTQNPSSKASVNQELPDVQTKFRKGRRTRDHIANICWIIEKAREFQTNVYFCFNNNMVFTVWITTNCGKFLRDGIPDHLTSLLRTCLQVK